MNFKLIFSTFMLAAIMGSAHADGKATYTQKCAMCHATGAANAPKTGDKAAWAPRTANGIDALVASATKGKGAMPPKGTCNDCSADDLKAAIEFMIK